MKVLVRRGDIADFKSEAVVVPHFEDGKGLQGKVRLLDKRSGGLIREIIGGGDFEGKYLQVSVTYTRGMIPAKRIGQAENVAGAAIFLASQAGSFCVGSNIVVDGGESVRGVQRAFYAQIWPDFVRLER